MRWFITFTFAVFGIMLGDIAHAQYHTSYPEKDVAASERRCASGDEIVRRNNCIGLVRYYDSIGKAGGDRGLTANQAFKKKIDRAETACKVGGAFGCEAAGWAYDHGAESREIDLAKAAEYYEKGCKLHSGLSCNNLGLMYQQGRGLAQNTELAKSYFEKACKKNYKDACPKDEAAPDKPKAKLSYTEQIRLDKLNTFQKLCDQGQARYCWSLGWEYVAQKKWTRGSSQFTAQMKKACDMGHAQACKDMTISSASAQTAGAQNNRQQSPPYTAMEFGPVQDAYVKQGRQSACIEVYNRMRGEDPEAYVVAEHICYTFNRSQYCYEAGMDLMTGRGNTLTNRDRAYNNFYHGCYIRDKGQAESCYYGALISLAQGGRSGSYDAMLMLETPCYRGYRDSCDLKKKAQRTGDAAVAAANNKLRANHDEAMNCKKTRMVGHGGREYTSYDCRTNREWRLGKKR